MKVYELINELKRQQRYGNGKLEVKLFAHDHNPEKRNEGVGTAFFVDEFTDEDGYNFVAIRA